MNVKNRKCIRKLSLKSLYANRRRNLIAIFAIALTTLLFTSMFTIVLSLNASYETYQFRQVGGYAHGTFKDVSPEQAERIAAHPKVKATGARKVIGITADGVFSKSPAEISYMDANCTKWSYATPTIGRMPESGKEVAMDTAALQLLGVTPELGAEVTVSYSITDKDQTAFAVTDKAFSSTYSAPSVDVYKRQVQDNRHQNSADAVAQQQPRRNADQTKQKCLLANDAFELPGRCANGFQTVSYTHCVMILSG